MSHHLIAFLGSLLLFTSCAITDGERDPEDLDMPEESTQSSELIQSCYDWSGTCTGLPEGAACGDGGTCFADFYGVAGFCTCWEPPPPAGSTCPGVNSCSGVAAGGSCQRWNGTSGTCVPFYAGQTNALSGCVCQ